MNMQAPIPSIKSSSSPDRLCSAAVNSCPAVSKGKFSFRNKQDTGWIKKGTSAFRSRDVNFGRLINDRPRIRVSPRIQALIQAARNKLCK